MVEYRAKASMAATPGQENPVAESTDPQDNFDESTPVDQVALKLRGLPYSVTVDDIVQFFHGFGLIEDSVKIGRMGDGKLTGEACVLFENAKDCSMAHRDRNKKYISNRWIELFPVSASEHDNFHDDQSSKYNRSYNDGYSRGGRGGYQRGGYPSSGSYRGRGRGGYYAQSNTSGGYTEGHSSKERTGGYQKTTYLSEYVTPENQYRSLKLRSLPYSAGVKEIREFFGDFRVAERDVIIDIAHGRPTGYALVFLENEEEAARAKKDLDRKHLGSRYIDVIYPDVKDKQQ